MTASQQALRRALLDPSRPVPPGLRDGAGRPAGARFDVHRNNIAASLIDALRVGFPVIARLLGRASMDRLAGVFLRAHPPRTPVLMHYGTGFPGFLEARPELAHLGYLGDVARLELALRQSYHAGDAAPFEPARLAGIPPESLLHATLRLAPATRLVRSVWPIHDIWRFNTLKGAPAPRAIPQDVLITRPGFDPAPHPLPPGGADWIDALTGGQTLLQALRAARVGTPGFDPGATLRMLVQGQTITALTVKDHIDEEVDFTP